MTLWPLCQWLRAHASPLVVITLCVVSGSSCSTPAAPTAALAEPESKWSFTFDDAAPGQSLYVALPGFETTAKKPVHVLSAKVLKASKLMRTRVLALRRSESGDVYGWRGDISHLSPAARLHPVSEIRLEPGRRSDWYVVVELRSDRIGRHRVEDIRFRFESGGHEETKDYRLKIAMNLVSRARALPDDVP